MGLVMRNFFSVCAFLMLSLACLVTQGQTIADIVASSGGEFDSNFQDYDILLTALETAESGGCPGRSQQQPDRVCPE